MKPYIKILFISLVVNQIFIGQDFRYSNDRDAFIFSQFNNEINELNTAQKLFAAGNRNEAIEMTCDYFSNTVSNRFFFNWKKFKNRVTQYSVQHSSRIDDHKRRASEMMELYYADNDWNLPMESKSGANISAYELRHLARQHKSIDVMFTYFLEEENEVYLNYIMEMVKSLETSYVNDTFEKKGNGVFESFRAGYRVYNWLFVYNALCASSKFTNEYKFQFIKSFYYHAVELQKATDKFRYGNHHTKGLVALALTAMVFPEFKESGTWLKQSIGLLTEHLQKEINEDGFQFERSVHYHIGDIDNYFYVFYIAKINNIILPEEFEKTLFKMFESLAKLAYPNKTLPVLQDDTDNPWAEYNRMSNVMSLGAVLFDNESFKYFASDEISSGKYWFVSEADKETLKDMKSKPPTTLSESLPATGYYSMRNGWNKNDIVVTVSAGLSEYKPDHQHGDMLGMQLYAYENYMLPNYQVRYYLNEYLHFKNSFVKNICVVDSIPQGREWKPNSGGSGFGKFRLLPEPKVESFYTSAVADVFIGTINYAESDYERKVIFVKDGFVIVKDMLKSDEPREFQQIWQGYYSKENNSHFRSTFSNGSGLDVVQLNQFKEFTISPIVRGKSSIVFNSDKVKQHEFLTLLYPFGEFDIRLDERKELNEITMLGWNYKEELAAIGGYKIDAGKIFYGNNCMILISARKINDSKFVADKPDILINLNNNSILLLESKKTKLSNSNTQLEMLPFIEYPIEGNLK